MSRIEALLFASVLLWSGSAVAQQKPTETKKKTARPKTEAEKKAYAKRKAEIRKRIMDYRARMKKGEILRTNVKVRVRLRNEETMTGVVRNGNFVEKPNRLEFVRAEMTAKGAGLRLWYYDNTDGYIFIPYTLIKTYKILKKLTDVEIKEIREAILERERLAKETGEKRKKELLNKQRELREGKKASEKLEKLTQKFEADKKKAEKEKKLLALVTEFPPAEGWGEEKIKQINLRRITMKVYPNPKERRFIEVYDDWKLGVALKEEQDKKKGKATEPGKGYDPAKPKPDPAKPPVEPDRGR